jgi:hypothetical protein
MSTQTLQLLSQSHWLADGSQTVWNFSFTGGYINPSHVRAYKRSPSDVRTEITINYDTDLVGPFQLLITPAVAAGDTLVIYRDSSNGGLPLVDFADGASLDEASLDVVAKQSVFISAETEDYIGVSSEADLIALGVAAAASAGAAAASASLADSSADSSDASRVLSEAAATAASGSAASASASAVAAAATLVFNPAIASSYPYLTLPARVDKSGHPSQTNVLLGGGVANDSALTGIRGYRTTAVGVGAAAAISSVVTAGGSNSWYGYGTGAANREGSGNSIYGALGMTANVDGDHNNGFGYRVLDKHTASVQNNVFGFEGMFSLTAGANNSGFGESVLYSSTNSNGVTAMGAFAFYTKTSGDFSTGFGFQVGFSETTATGGSYFGYRAGYSNTTQAGCSYFGYDCGNGPVGGQFNSGFGYEVLKSLNTGQFNSGFGYWALRRLTTGSSNQAYGQQAGSFITTGSQNTLVGDSAGFGISTASGCVGIGSATLNNNNGSNCTAVGNGALSPGSAQTWTNSTAIGNGAQVTGSNQVAIGNSAVVSTQLVGDLVVAAGAATGNAAFAGNLLWTLPASVTPGANSQISIQLTDNTHIAIKVRGTDGVVRSVTLTLT